MSKSIGDKLDKLIRAVDNLTTKLDSTEKKYYKRLDLLQINFDDRFKKIEKISTETAKRSDLEDIKLKVDNWEKNGKAVDKVKQHLEDRLKKIESVLNNAASDRDLEELYERLHYLEYAEKDRRATAIAQESYDKRFNIIFHSLEEKKQLCIKDT